MEDFEDVFSGIGGGWNSFNQGLGPGGLNQLLGNNRQPKRQRGNGLLIFGGLLILLLVYLLLR